MNENFEAKTPADGGPAFPLSNSHVDYEHTSWAKVNGMTLHDYMAAKAMQGIMASGRWDVVGANIIASEAYEIADAMIRAREAS